MSEIEKKMREYFDKIATDLERTKRVLDGELDKFKKRVQGFVDKIFK